MVGASENPTRISHQAVLKLVSTGYPVIATGGKTGHIGEIPITTSLPSGIKIDTITLYIRPELQNKMQQELLCIKPRRIIFNPGTENPTFEKLAKSKGILTENACTLVLLSLNQYNDF